MEIAAREAGRRFGRGFAETEYAFATSASCAESQGIDEMGEVCEGERDSEEKEG